MIQMKQSAVGACRTLIAAALLALAAAAGAALPAAAQTACDLIDLGSGQSFSAYGSWSDEDCRSTERPGSSADLYRLRLPMPATALITLASTDADAHLALTNAAGRVLARNDDHGDGTDSRIELALEAGVYSIEAATFEPAEGSYRLRARISPREVVGEPAVQVSAGQDHACALTESGEAECWGWNAFGQTDAPPGPFTQISAGTFHTCALRADGGAACWGDDGNGQASPPAGRFTQVSAGGLHSCGLAESGAAVCWGSNHDWDGERLGQATPPAGRFTQISAGGFHTCALAPGGRPRCWGGNSDLHGTYARQADPLRGPFSRISAGGFHTCALTLAGEARCWGGDDDWDGEPLGQADPPAGRFTQISAGGWTTCGLTTAGAVRCWGLSGDEAPSAASVRFTQVDAGRHACALAETGAVQCWGDDEYGEATPPIFGTPAVPQAALGTGRISARRLADGRTEFSFEPAQGERLLPATRFFPAGAEVGRWLYSSPIDVGTAGPIRLSARKLEDGQTEFSLVTDGNRRILPLGRFFPAEPAINRWLRSTELNANP